MLRKLKVLDRATSDAFERHRARWSDCVRCEIGRIATKHVFARGTLPCDILFIGEAPGVSEDALGKPFVGESGDVLDKWILETQTAVIDEDCKGRRQRLPDSGFSYAITNTVCCRPTDAPGGKNRAPSPEEQSNCGQRFLRFVDIAAPRGVVLLGKVAENRWFDVDSPIPKLAVYHPAYLLRSGGLRSDRGKGITQGVVKAMTEFVLRVMKEVPSAKP